MVTIEPPHTAGPGGRGPTAIGDLGSTPNDFLRLVLDELSSRGVILDRVAAHSLVDIIYDGAQTLAPSVQPGQLESAARDLQEFANWLADAAAQGGTHSIDQTLFAAGAGWF
jgi:hypothetical protein